jgi:hypothetical protein
MKKSKQLKFVGYIQADAWNLSIGLSSVYILLLDRLVAINSVITAHKY